MTTRPCADPLVGKILVDRAALVDAIALFRCARLRRDWPGREGHDYHTPCCPCRSDARAVVDVLEKGAP
jgi:hypothetical protein